MSWLMYLSCSPSTGTSVGEWVSFIFLSPCPQCVLVCFVDFLFLLSLFVFVLQKLFSSHRRPKETTFDAAKPLLLRFARTPAVRTTWRFKLPLALSCLLGIAFLILVIPSILDASSPFTFRLVQSITLFIQSLSNLATAAIIAHEKRFRAISHPLTLRLYWVASFIVSVILSTSSIILLSSCSTILADDIISVIFLLLFAAFLIFSFSRSTGIHPLQSIYGSSSTAEISNFQPKANVTGYNTASVL